MNVTASGTVIGNVTVAGSATVSLPAIKSTSLVFYTVGVNAAVSNIMPKGYSINAGVSFTITLSTSTSLNVFYEVVL